MRLVLTALLFAAPLYAQETKDDEQLKKELERALKADEKPQAPPAATSGTPPPAPLARGSQSLNPDMSAILDADAGYQRRPFSFLNGDDPDLKAAPGTAPDGPQR